MMTAQARTAEGDAATDVVLATFRANGLLHAAGHRLAEQEGLTAARWQVPRAIAESGQNESEKRIWEAVKVTSISIRAFGSLTFQQSVTNPPVVVWCAATKSSAF